MNATSDSTSIGKIAVRTGWMTLAYLAGGLVLAFSVALPLDALLVHAPEPAKIAVAATLALTVMTLAARAWARAVSRAAGCGEDRRVAWAGMLGFGPVVIATGVALALLEGVVPESGSASGLPIHVVYTILFVPATFLVAGVAALALAWAVSNLASAWRPAAMTGLAAAGAFLVADVLMDLAGWRVGGPNAAARATMLVVTTVGCAGAALAGGAVLGASLARVPRPPTGANGNGH